MTDGGRTPKYEKLLSKRTFFFIFVERKDKKSLKKDRK